jgi:hypothetical protein
MFAATKGAGARRSVSETFTSTTSWVSPTSRIAVASGYGGPATADSETFGETGYAYATFVFTPQPTAPYAQWGTLDAAANNIESIISGNVGTNFISLPSPQYFIDPSDNYSSITYGPAFWIVGNTAIKVQRGSHPSTGNILFSQLGAGGDFGWYVAATYRVLGSNGSSTDAFSLSFAGGTLVGPVPYRTAAAPATTTYTNITVIPGTTYTINVPPGGSLTITYLV